MRQWGLAMSSEHQGTRISQSHISVLPDLGLMFVPGQHELPVKAIQASSVELKLLAALDYPLDIQKNGAARSQALAAALGLQVRGQPCIPGRCVLLLLT